MTSNAPHELTCERQEPRVKDHLLGTSHLLENLRNRTISGGVITMTAQGVLFVLTLAATVVLARLLRPHDYGLLAMAATVLGFLRILNDVGLSTVTIQREGITNAQVSNLFWVNVAVAFLMMAVVASSAPVVAWFYNEPALVAITLVLSVSFPLTGLTVQHTALLQRQMRFVAVSAIQVSALLCSIVVGVALAWRGASYWSLVAMQVTQPVVMAALTWLVVDWRPSVPTFGQGTRSLIRFGADLTATNLVWSVARNVDGVLVGRIYGSDSLGLYSRAGSLLSRPLEQIVGPMTSVLIPMLSRIQSDPRRYRRIFLQVLEVISLVSFLVTGFFLALSNELTVLVLGRQWETAAQIFAGFAPCAIFLPLNSAASCLLASQGRGREWLVAATWSSMVAVGSFVIGSWFGPVWVATCYSIGGVTVLLPILYHTAGRSGPVTTADLWRASFQHLPVLLAVVSVTVLVRHAVSDAQLLVRLVVSGLAGLGAGVVCIAVYSPARRTAMELLDGVRRFRMAV
jgi:PST family polysaccharide transporter